jgi:tetratricopeptide (TPR) repeat protein
MPVVDKSNQRYLQIVKEFNDRAVACRQEKNFKCAIADFTRAIELASDFAVAFYNRGRLRLKKGDWDRAIADLKKALKIDPDFSRAYCLLSRLLKSDSRDVTVEPNKMLLTREED